MSIEIPVPNAELVDKLTILNVKLEKIKNHEQQVHIQREWNALLPLLGKIGFSVEHELYKELLNVNRNFFDYHSYQRSAWKKMDAFPENYVDIELYRRSREEHTLNDQRARLKARINHLTKSALVEQKQFPVYSIGLPTQ